MPKTCGWCKGTGGECGCGYGYCTHCGGSGALPDQPCGMNFNARRTDSEAITDDQISELVDWWFAADDCDNNDFVRKIEHEIFGSPYMTEEEIDAFGKYHDDPYRDETIGEYVKLVAEFIFQKITKG